MKRFDFLLLSLFFLVQAGLLPAQTVEVSVPQKEIYPDGWVYGKYSQGDVDPVTGNRVVVWQEADAPGLTTTNIFFQLFKPDYTQTPVIWDSLTSRIAITANTAQTQGYLAVKVNSKDGSFAVAWGSNFDTSTDFDVYVKKFRISDGVALSGDVLVNAYTTGRQAYPQLAFDYQEDELIVAWLDLDGADTLHSDGSMLPNDQGSFFRRVDYSSMMPIGNDVQINVITPGNQYITSIAVSPITDELLTTCQSAGYSSQNRVVFRKFVRNTDGTFSGSSETLIDSDNDSYGADYPRITLNETSGDYIITWNQMDNSGWGVRARGFDRYSLEIIANFLINTNYQTDNQRDAKLVWDQLTGYYYYFYYFSNGSQSDIRSQIYSNKMQTVGSEIRCLPVSPDMNLNNEWSDYSLGFDLAAKKVFLTYRQSESLNSANGKIFLEELTYENPAFTADTERTVPVSVTDQTMNWVEVTSYDENGNVISQSRKYSDNLGRSLQTQTRNVPENTILASATLYDRLGRPAIQTLPAPVSNTDFSYVSDFVTADDPVNGSVSYSDTCFDANSQGQGSVYNPYPVYSDKNLGWYYSDNNTTELYTGTTKFPYTRINYNDVAGGIYKSVSSPGDSLRMGAGHESGSATVPVLFELDHYLALRPYYVPGSDTSGFLALNALKTISVDANGVETVVFRDHKGKVLATALSGQENGANKDTLWASWYETLLSQGGTMGTVTMANGDTNAFIEVFEGAALIYTGTVSGFNIYAGDVAGQAIRILARSAFSYPDAGTSAVQTDHITVSDYLDIHIPDGMGALFDISGTGTYAIMDLMTGSSTSLTNVQAKTEAGYYRVFTLTGTVTVKAPANYYNFAYYYYDDAGRLVAEVSPKGVNLNSTAQPSMASTYTYNSLGWMLSSQTPDEGLVEYVYRKDGKLRFSQNRAQVADLALQQTVNKLSYTNYDDLGRTLASGEYLMEPHENFFIWENQKQCDTSTDTDGIHTLLEERGILSGLVDSLCENVTLVYYDTIMPGLPAGRTQNFQNFAVSKTERRNFYTDTVPLSETWYSYDIEGNTEWVIQQMDGFGAKTIDYSYDLLGNVLDVIYERDNTSERFEHRYEYDAAKRLEQVSTRVGTGSLTTQASYQYYLHGPLKRMELGDVLQGLDYVYTVQGWLKSMNHVNLTNLSSDPGNDGDAASPDNPNNPDLFALNLDYFYEDYLKTNSNVFTMSSDLTGGPQYNGNIACFSFNTRRTGSDPGIGKAYCLTYDKKYQLAEGVFGTNVYNYETGNSFKADQDQSGNPTGKWNEYDIAYDANGNLNQLKRNDSSGAQSNPLTWLYYNAPNQLSSLSFTNPNYTPYPERNFAYNAIGQMTYDYTDYQNIQTSVTQSYQYDPYGNVTGIYGDYNYIQPKFTFAYNERGQRIRRSHYDTSYTETQQDWYVYDLSGNIMAIYKKEVSSGTVTLEEQPMYGMSRLGTWSGFEYDYELKDHLGNVRVVFRDSSGYAAIVSWKDYYPFGSITESWNNGTTYRYGYQGEFAEDETDATGFNNFDLRMYDPNLGRWFAPDPYHQSHSPYSAMGNNPINFTDPSGGWFDDIYLDTDGSELFRVKNDLPDRYYQATYNPGEMVGYWREVGAPSSDIVGIGKGHWLSHPESYGKPSAHQQLMYNFANDLGSFLGNSISFAMGGFAEAGFSSMASGGFRFFASKTSTRVFWSGGNVAKNTAASFAKNNGMKTLEMTTRGRIMNTLNSVLPRSVSSPIWRRLSTNFAKGAKGEAHFFTTPVGPRSGSIWLNIEKPILQQNGVRIITH